MLKPITDRAAFSRAFAKKFSKIKIAHPQFASLLDDLPAKTNIYAIGGFLRSVSDSKHKANDLDIIVSCSGTVLKNAMKKSFPKVGQNRMGGFKIKLKKQVIDIWTLSNHYGLKRGAAKTEIHAIAKSCFFNFDSIIFDIKNKKLCVRYYNRSLRERKLDIIIKN